MGIFGSRRVTSVGTSVMRVMEDKTLPNSIVTGSLMAIQQADGQMIEHAVEELTNGLGIRVDRLYRYAKAHYINGLPTGSVMQNLIGKDTIADAIAAETGKEIGMGYYHVGPLNMLHLGWLLLCKNYDYDSRDNSLLYGDKRAYLTDMQVIVVDATKTEIDSGSLDMWGVSPASGTTPLRPYPGVEGDDADRPVYVANATATEDHLLVKVCYEVAATKVVEGVTVPSKVVEEAQFTMPVNGWNMAASYYQASYTVDARNNFWLYEMGSEVNPVIEAIFDTAPSENGTFFPMAYFRYDKQAITEENPDFATTKKMLNIVNMNLDDTVTAINENPDIADVEQAMMIFAVAADSDAAIDQRYLYEFFNSIWVSDQLANPLTRTITPVDTLLSKTMGAAIPKSAMVIQDKKFKMTVNWDTIVKRRVTGKVTKKGHYTSDIGKKTDNVVKVEMPGDTVMELNTGVPRYIYQHQITEEVYEEVEVTGIQTKYYVWGDYTTTGDEDNNAILLIPLDYAIAKEYTIIERELLYARSMHYVFNSRVVTKLKWYQTGIFKVILIVIAIIITIASNGTTWQLVVAAWEAGGIIALIFALIPIIVKYVLVSLIVRKVVTLIGIKAAFIIAIIAAVYGYYQAMAEGGIANAPWAASLLQMSSNLTSAVGNELKAEYRDLEHEYRDFEEYAKDRKEALDRLNASMDGQVHLVPMIIWGETPDEFYQRTVHYGNIGTVGIEAVSSFVDAALTLPKLTDSIGDFYV